MTTHFDAGLPTLVCLHSSASSPCQWQMLTDAARGKWNVVSPHLLGYGDALPSGPETRMHDHVQYLDGLVADLPGPLHLAGHSMGGAVALRYAMRHPGRLASLSVYEPVCFDLLFGAHTSNAAADEINHLGNLVVYQVLRGALDSAAELFVDYWNRPGTWAATPAETRKRLFERMPMVAWEFQALFDRIPGPESYARLDLPVQVLNGTASPEPARLVAERLAELMPGCLRCELPGLDHMGPITHPAVVDPLILGFADDNRRPARVSRAA